MSLMSSGSVRVMGRCAWCARMFGQMVCVTGIHMNAAENHTLVR